MTRFHAKTLKKLWGREKDKILSFSYFLDSSFTFKAAKQFVMSFFSVFVNFLALKCAVEYYRTSNRCFKLVISRSFHYFRSRVLKDSIACVVDSLNPCYRLFIKN